MKKRIAVGLAALVGALALGTTAEASGIGAFSGQPTTQSTWSCFNEDYGAVHMSCLSASDQWEVALPVSTTGNFSPSVFEYEYASGSLSCGVCAMPSDGTAGTYSCPAQKSPSATGYGSIALQTVSVATNGYLFVDCYLEFGDEWYTTTW